MTDTPQSPKSPQILRVLCPLVQPTCLRSPQPVRPRPQSPLRSSSPPQPLRSSSDSISLVSLSPPQSPIPQSLQSSSDSISSVLLSPQQSQSSDYDKNKKYEGQSRYYDLHTICIQSEGYSREQLEHIFRTSLRRTRKELNMKLACDFRVNTIIKKGGDYLGVSYLFVSNPEVYHLLCGRNADGSDHKEEMLISHGESASDSWADIAEEEEYIDIQLPPLMTLASLKLEPSFVLDVPDVFRCNVLCSRNIPEGLTKEDIRAAILPFCPSRKTYPLVEISHQIAFVTFDPSTRDAQFVLLMIKRLRMEKSGVVHFLGFCHAFGRKKGEKADTGTEKAVRGEKVVRSEKAVRSKRKKNSRKSQAPQVSQSLWDVLADKSDTVY